MNLFGKEEKKFKDIHPLEKRREEARKIKEKYPDRIPVIIERARGSDVPDIDKKKYLVPKDLTVAGLLSVIRKRIRLRPEQSLFIHVNNRLPSTSDLIEGIYQENKEECGFLYVVYSGENTFG